MGSSLPSVISPVMRHVRAALPFTDVLDIGVGESGQWGLLLRDKCEGMLDGRKFRDTSTWKLKIVGIEIMEEYNTVVHQFLYDRILWMDAFEALNELNGRACDPKFDVVFLTSVIEHFEKERGIELLKKIKRVMRNGAMLVLTTPNGYEPQRPTENNPNDKHLCGWTVEDIDSIKKLGYIVSHHEITYDNRLIIIARRK
jgi:SAM-dependent methyltransferase